MSFYKSFQARQARPVIPKNVHVYGGFKSLNELIEPKLRPSAEVNTAGKLIRHTFKQLEKTLKRAFVFKNKCTVYFPWSNGDNSWAFALFTVGKDVKALLTQLALEFQQKYHGKESIRVILNQYDPKNPATNYRQLVSEVIYWYLEIMSPAKVWEVLPLFVTIRMRLECRRDGWEVRKYGQKTKKQYYSSAYTRLKRFSARANIKFSTQDSNSLNKTKQC